MTPPSDDWWTPRTDVPLHAWRPSAFEMLPAAMPEARQVHERIWVSTGLSHSWLITTDDGRVIVNTGMGFESPVHKRNFDAVDDSATRAIIFTQGHTDHVGGADHFREEGTELIAQAGNAEHLEQGRQTGAVPDRSVELRVRGGPYARAPSGSSRSSGASPTRPPRRRRSPSTIATR